MAGPRTTSPVYREEIGDVIALRDEVEAHWELYSLVRLHESLG